MDQQQAFAGVRVRENCFAQFRVFHGFVVAEVKHVRVLHRRQYGADVLGVTYFRFAPKCHRIRLIEPAIEIVRAAAADDQHLRAG